MAKPGDLLKANALAAAVGKLTGFTPQVLEYPDYVEVNFPPDVRAGIVGYLDQQIGSLLTGRKTAEDLPSVQVRWGQVLAPWSLRMLLPAGALLFGLGYAAKAYQRRSQIRS
jgi:hypothetical protein